MNASFNAKCCTAKFLFILAQPFRMTYIDRDEGKTGMNKIMPVVLSLIPLVAVIGACMTTT